MHACMHSYTYRGGSVCGHACLCVCVTICGCVSVCVREGGGVCVGVYIYKYMCVFYFVI